MSLSAWKRQGGNDDCSDGTECSSAEREKKETKDPITRLLDLTLGWGEYVEKDEADYSDSVKSNSIYSLYQSVAGFVEPVWDAAPEVQEAVVRQFVETQLLPMLLGKSKPEAL